MQTEVGTPLPPAVQRNCPAERCNGRKGGENLTTLDIGRCLDFFCRRTACTSLCRLNLSKARHIRVSQNQADVGMGDQAPSRIDHIGLTVFADLDLRDNVPDELEIHFRDAHAGVASRTGERQRHVWFDSPAKINRAIVDLVFNGFGKLGLSDGRFPLPHNIHGQA